MGLCGQPRTSKCHVRGPWAADRSDSQVDSRAISQNQRGSSNQSSEHECGVVVDTDGCAWFYWLIVVHDASAVRQVAASHVDPLRRAVIGRQANSKTDHVATR